MGNGRSGTGIESAAEVEGVMAQNNRRVQDRVGENEAVGGTVLQRGNFEEVDIVITTVRTAAETEDGADDSSNVGSSAAGGGGAGCNY